MKRVKSYIQDGYDRIQNVWLPSRVLCPCWIIFVTCTCTYCQFKCNSYVRSSLHFLLLLVFLLHPNALMHLSYPCGSHLFCSSTLEWSPSGQETSKDWIECPLRKHSWTTTLLLPYTSYHCGPPRWCYIVEIKLHCITIWIIYGNKVSDASHIILTVRIIVFKDIWWTDKYDSGWVDGLSLPLLYRRGMLHSETYE